MSKRANRSKVKEAPLPNAGLPSVVPEDFSEMPDPMYTLQGAFDYNDIPVTGDEEPSSSELNHERSIRAVGFLLHYCSVHGNEKVHGQILDGLGHVLDETASRISFSRKSGEFWRLRKAARG